MQVTFRLTDRGDNRNETLPGEIKANRTGIEISFWGYGEKTADPGHGEPILIELCNGVPRVVIWGDINSENPTHIITLEGARESNRKEQS